MTRRNIAFLLGLFTVVLAIYLLRDGAKGEGPKGNTPANVGSNTSTVEGSSDAQATNVSKPERAAKKISKTKTRWVPGLQIDYELKWNQSFQITINDTKGEPVHVVFFATWRLTVTDVQEDSIYVRSEYLKPSFRADAYPDELNGLINQQLKSTSYLVFSPNGAIRDALYHPNLQMRTRMVSRTSSFTFQFVHPSRSNLKTSWRVREQDMVGSYHARYEPLEDGRIKKTKPVLIEVRGEDPNKNRPRTQSGFTGYFHTDLGWPERVEVRDDVVQDRTKGNPNIQSSTTAQLRRIAVRSVPSPASSLRAATCSGVSPS